MPINSNFLTCFSNIVISKTRIIVNHINCDTDRDGEEVSNGIGSKKYISFFSYFKMFQKFLQA